MYVVNGNSKSILSYKKMSKKIPHPLKSLLRKRIKSEVLAKLSNCTKAEQSKLVTRKVLESDYFHLAKRVCIYLSTIDEVDTMDILTECFRQGKYVFVPTYNGPIMEAVRLKDLQDYEELPKTKWNIKQPTVEGRENALTNGFGIDLFLVPGLAFSRSGGRLGHGMGYYDTYLHRHQLMYPNKSTIYIALAFKEQIVAESELPLEPHDVTLHGVITP